MVNRLLVVTLTLFFSLSFVSSATEIGFGDETGQTGVNIFLPEELNITNVFVNNTNHSNSTDYWITSIGPASTVNDTQFNISAGTLSLDVSWLTQFINLGWCALSGCNMTGNLNTTGNITADTFIGAFVGDGSGLTNITGLGDNNFNEYYTSSRMQVVIENLSKSDVAEVNEIVQPGSHYIYGGELV